MIINCSGFRKKVSLFFQLFLVGFCFFSAGCNHKTNAAPHKGGESSGDTGSPVELSPYFISLSASPTTIPSSGQNTATITVTLSHKNPTVSLANKNISLVAPSPIVTVSPSSITTNEKGQGSFTVTANATGEVTLTATDTTDSNTPVGYVHFTVIPGDQVFYASAGMTQNLYFTVNIPANPLSFMNPNAKNVTCSIVPALPDGLTLSPSTCQISGTPQAMMGPAVYTVTANTSLGTATQTVNILVVGIFGANALAEHMCSITATGNVTCWGQNNRLQLGGATSQNIALLEPPASGGSFSSPSTIHHVTQISLQQYSTCALSSVVSSSIACWGSIYSSLAPPTMPVGACSAGTLKGLSTVIQHPSLASLVPFGNDAACVLDDTKNVRCWGDNTKGQLGLLVSASSSNCYKNAMYLSGLNTAIKNKSMTQSSSGSITALGSTNMSSGCAWGANPAHALQCWGDNHMGQLGIPLNKAKSVGFRGYGQLFMHPGVMFTDTVHTSVIQLSSGGANSICALVKNRSKTDVTSVSTASVFCWGGMNHLGQLSAGAGAVGSKNTAPIYQPSSFVPLDTALGDPIQISVGKNHACALFQTTSTNSHLGNMQCWGDNTYGQLGNSRQESIEKSIGSTIYFYNAKPVTVSHQFVSGVIQVICVNNTTCALLNNGQMQCWGDNTHGQLGSAAIKIGDYWTEPQHTPIANLP